MESHRDDAIKKLSIVYGLLDDEKAQDDMTMAKLMMEMVQAGNLGVEVTCLKLE